MGGGCGVVVWGGEGGMCFLVVDCSSSKIGLRLLRTCCLICFLAGRGMDLNIFGFFQAAWSLALSLYVVLFKLNTSFSY